MTDEKREKLRARWREQARKTRVAATAEQRERRLAKVRESRARETPEQYEARLAATREWHARPASRRHVFTDKLKRLYGISREEYDLIVLASCGRCDACGKQDTNDKKGLCLDHDHATGEIRGMLCWGCNTALGNLRDSPLLIAKLAAYASGIGRSA